MNKKKKKHRKPPRDSTPPLPSVADAEAALFGALVEAFAKSVSPEDVPSACKDILGNPNPGAEALASRLSETLASNLSEADDHPSTCSTSSDSVFGKSSLSGSSDGYVEADFVGDRNGLRDRFKPKMVVASTGTVSSVLGKEYLKADLQKGVEPKPVGFRKIHDREDENKEKVQFLCTMLGEENELNFDVVRDVLCQCAYDVERALDVLLDFSASSHEHANIVFANHPDNGDGINDSASDYTSHSCDSELPDNIWSLGVNRRNSPEPSTIPEIQFLPPNGDSKLNASQEVLGSLYKVSKSPQHAPKTMNWRKMAKKMGAFGSGYDVPDCPTKPPVIPAEGGEYSLLRTKAQHHWDSMKSSYQKAAAAYSRGDKSYAAYLSDQGRKYSVMGQAADEKASLEIFKVRNKNIENDVTIDLHGQHVKQALNLLKIHLLLPSIKKLRVITGCGTHGMGKSKLKQSVLKLAEKEGIEWIEENRGTIMLKLDGQTDYSFVDSDSDSG
ncbi:hypothetical protein MLD38_025190 [Melastoma candidum]|uniref:Uncharacterized protein n=1 Tax=Melastoma candidum TaxID=119954 RepID=A0ACB9NVK2_9MYRT|nr:hypothetical protein MLD38_025190 [Melastoma candidum]